MGSAPHADGLVHIAGSAGEPVDLLQPDDVGLCNRIGDPCRIDLPVPPSAGRDVAGDDVLGMALAGRLKPPVRAAERTAQVRADDGAIVPPVDGERHAPRRSVLSRFFESVICRLTTAPAIILLNSDSQ